MAYIQHNRLTILGDYFSGVDSLEEWQISINFGYPGTAPDLAKPSQNAEMEGAIKAWWNGAHVGGHYMQSTRLLGFKWNAIGPDGRYVTPQLPNTVLFTPPVPGKMTGYVPKFPTQIAQVFSLRTGLKGKSFNGRLYMPGPDLNLLAGWFLDPSYLQPQAAAMASFLSTLAGFDNNWGVGGNIGKPVIASTKGFNSYITSVRLGNRLDTQRRRRRSLVETYSTDQPL